MATPASQPPPDTAERDGNVIIATIYAEPVAQPRQRHSVDRRTGFVRNYTPAKHPVNALKKRIRKAVASVIDRPWDGCVALSMGFQFPRPKNKIWKRKPMPSYPHVGKPDLDNLAKAVMDALTKVLYVDDSQISRISMWKDVVPGDIQDIGECLGDPWRFTFPSVEITAWLHPATK